MHLATASGPHASVNELHQRGQRLLTSYPYKNVKRSERIASSHYRSGALDDSDEDESDSDSTSDSGCESESGYDINSSDDEELLEQHLMLYNWIDARQKSKKSELDAMRAQIEADARKVQQGKIILEKLQSDMAKEREEIDKEKTVLNKEKVKLFDERAALLAEAQKVEADRIKAEILNQDDSKIKVRELETKLQEREAKLERFEAQWKAVGHVFGHQLN